MDPIKPMDADAAEPSLEADAVAAPADDSEAPNEDAPVETPPLPETETPPYQPLLDQLRVDEWNTELWTRVLDEASADRREHPEWLRRTFEAFLKTFPTSARHWLAYCDFELNGQKDLARAEAAFRTCLLEVPSLPLWRQYLGYVQRTHPLQGADVDEAANRLTVGRAFEHVLEHVGLDLDSGSVWLEYLQFIASEPVTTPKEESQKMDLLRHTYTRALQVPTTNIETLWRNYDVFENGMNRILAKKLLAERSPAYMMARSTIRELMAMTNAPKKQAETWLATPPRWNEGECQLLLLWKRYAAWERTNPLRLSSEPAFVKRVVYAYRLALATHRHYAEVWWELAEFLMQYRLVDDAADILRRGIAILPASLLLRGRLVAVLEERKAPFTDIALVFDELLAALQRRVDARAAHCELAKAQHVSRAAARRRTARTDEDGGEMDGDAREREREREQALQAELQALEDTRDEKIAAVEKSEALAWIQYIRVARRAAGIAAARALFSRARRTARCPHAVFVACAQIEYRCGKDAGVAERIFELGWKTFVDRPQAARAERAARGAAAGMTTAADQLAAAAAADFCTHYLAFFLELNDEHNARALFERIVANIDGAHARPVWDLFCTYENEYGDRGSLQRIEERRRDAFKDDITSLQYLGRAARQYECLGLAAVSEDELGIARLVEYADGLDDPTLSVFVEGSSERSASALLATAAAAASGPTVAAADPRAGTGDRRSVLTSVTPEKFARPNLDSGGWTAHQPESLLVLANGDLLPGDSGEIEPPLVPEPVAALLTELPGNADYHGPLIAADELLTVLAAVPVAALAAAYEMVPAPAPHYRRVVIPAAHNPPKTVTDVFSALADIAGLEHLVQRAPAVSRQPPVPSGGPGPTGRPFRGPSPNYGSDSRRPPFKRSRDSW